MATLTINVEDYTEPFVHEPLGQISWNNTHVALLSPLEIETQSKKQPLVLPMQSASEYYTYTNLSNWNNPKVNVYLIPWPETLENQETQLTTSVKPIEGIKKTFIDSTNFSRLNLNDRLKLLTGSRNPVNFQRSRSHIYPTPKQICSSKEADIFYNNRYMVICYNQEGFEITNIAQMNGFSLDCVQRETLHDFTLYLWEYKNKPIKIKTEYKDSPNNYELRLNLPPIKIPGKINENLDQITEIKPRKLLTFFQKLLSYKWLLLYAVGALGIILIIKKSVQSK